jgi:energy-coupling factor transporter ATP-binding protein EcfA2
MNNVNRILDASTTIIKNNPKGEKILFGFVALLLIMLVLLFYVVLNFNIVASIIIASVLWIVINIGFLFVFFAWGNKNQEKLEPIAKEIEREAEMSHDAFLINDFTDNIFTNTPLPISLKQIRIEEFKRIGNIHINSISIDSNWIFLIGENGSGKTTTLRGIAIGFLGRRDNNDILIDSFDTKIGIEFYYRGESIIRNLWTKSLEYNKFNVPLACYGPFRLELQKDSSENEEKNRSGITYGLFNNNGILLSIEFELKKLQWKNETIQLNKYTDILCKITGLASIEVIGDIVLYHEKDINDNIFSSVYFDQLASGIRSIIAMVGDMMIRLFKSQPEITEPSELAGIVIIDELDLHWHPKMQREIPSLLSSIFPKVQFIASTHSLVPLLGAPENSVLLKVNRTVEEGITVEKVDIDFQALSSDTMLRDIFDLEEYMSDPKIRAWERYTKLKGLIHFEKDEAKKNEYIHERENLGDKYNFTL